MQFGMLSGVGLGNYMLDGGWGHIGTTWQI